MPLTTLKSKQPSIYLQFRTWKDDRYRFLQLTIVRDDMKTIVQKDRVKELLDTQEKFHTDLREKAAKHNLLITSHCTDPEWNPPDYTKEVKVEGESRS